MSYNLKLHTHFFSQNLEHKKQYTFQYQVWCFGAVFFAPAGSGHLWISFLYFIYIWIGFYFYFWALLFYGSSYIFRVIPPPETPMCLHKTGSSSTSSYHHHHHHHQCCHHQKWFKILITKRKSSLGISSKLEKIKEEKMCDFATRCSFADHLTSGRKVEHWPSSSPSSSSSPPSQVEQKLPSSSCQHHVNFLNYISNPIAIM